MVVVPVGIAIVTVVEAGVVAMTEVIVEPMEGVLLVCN